MAKLVLVRSGDSMSDRSTFMDNDAPLTRQGLYQARLAGLALGPGILDIKINGAIGSEHPNAGQTFNTMMLARDRSATAIYFKQEAALNDRNYGVFARSTRDAFLNAVGVEGLHQIQADWEHSAEAVESLSDIHARVAPIHHRIVQRQLIRGRNMLVIADRDPLRAYMKELGQVPDTAVAGLDIGHGTLAVYDVQPNGQVVSGPHYHQPLANA